MRNAGKDGAPCAIMAMRSCSLFLLFVVSHPFRTTPSFYVFFSFVLLACLSGSIFPYKVDRFSGPSMGYLGVCNNPQTRRSWNFSHAVERGPENREFGSLVLYIENSSLPFSSRFLSTTLMIL